jgi:hypothetical protein
MSLTCGRKLRYVRSYPMVQFDKLLEGAALLGDHANADPQLLAGRFG